MNTPMDVVKNHPVRKSKQQKQAFRQEVTAWLESLGYPVSVERGSCRSHNIIIGDPRSAEYLITAHYDTCARLPFPNFITPCNFWIFLLYQIFVCILLIVPSAAVGGLVGYGLHSFEIGYFLFLILLWASILLMMIGPANPSNVNDNTSGVVTLLEIAKSLPQIQRRKVCFVLFDLEEAGLFGSASYRKKHKAEVGNQLVLNLDCVGEGDEIYLFPTGKLKKKPDRLHAIQKLAGSFGKKSISVRTKGFSVYPSDQMNFPYGLGICALRRGRVGLYLSRIHTPRDTVLDETNVNILRAALITFISGSAVQ